ncbi:hypothetical protein [[Eubacterium] cellulosolvens]
MSRTLVLAAALTIVLVLSSTQNVCAVRVSVMNPRCGPPGTFVTFTIHYDGDALPPTVSTWGSGWDALLSSILECYPGGLGGLTVWCRFTVPPGATGGFTYTATDELGSASATFTVACPAVGGVVMPVNAFAVLAPWLAVIGLVGCVATVVVVAMKRLQ